MNDAFDPMISDKEEIVPSSGFVASVMEAVREEAAAPQAIAFPWRRALPGLVALAAACVVFFVATVDMLRMPLTPSRMDIAAIESWPHELLESNTGWVAFAVLLTLLSLLFSFRLVRGQAETRF